MDSETDKTSNKVEINGWPVWYDKQGSGKKVLLLIPGAIGTGESDFKPQLEGPNAFERNKYTIITIELPGWGRSRPPKRRYDENVYFNDADCALKLMETLGFSSYSVIGWSDGAKVAALMSIKSPGRINNLVLIALFIEANRKTLMPTLSTRNTKIWSPQVYNNYLPVYGETTLQHLWDDYINFCADFMRQFPGGYWTNDLGKIRCPVLLIHGDLDPIVCLDHPLIVNKEIPDCRLHRFAKGSHNAHQTFSAEFKKLVEDFYDDCDDY